MSSLIDHLTNRFLSWPVPAEVFPDGTPGKPGRTGTNLLTAQQARVMLEYLLHPTAANTAVTEEQGDAFTDGYFTAIEEGEVKQTNSVLLRKALAGLVGASTKQEIQELRLALAAVPAPAADRVVMEAALQALEATATE